MRRRFSLWLATAAIGLGAMPAHLSAQATDSADFWLSQAQTDAVGLTDPSEKTGVLTAAASQWAAMGNKDAAHNAAMAALPNARQINDAGAQFRVYMGLAEVLDSLADAEGFKAAQAGAQAAADAMPLGPAKINAQRQLAEVRAGAQGLDQARKPIDALPDPGNKAQAFAALAARFSSIGRQADYQACIAAASSAADTVPDPLGSQMLKSLIVRTEADAGDIASASTLAATLKDPAALAAAYTAISAAQDRAGHPDLAKAAVDRVADAAQASNDDRKAAIWLDVARARQAQGDSAGASAALDAAVHAADRLEPADRADAYAAASRLKAQFGDQANAAVLADSAMTAARMVADPIDIAEVMMAVAAARARAGLGGSVAECLTAAESAGAKIDAAHRHPDGDPAPGAYLDIITAAADAGDFVTASAIAARVKDPGVKHDAALAIASAEVNLGQYQAAENTARDEGSPDAEASVCGMIASSLARTRNGGDALQWIKMLPTASDKVAADLAVAQWFDAKAHGASTQPAMK